MCVTELLGSSSPASMAECSQRRYTASYSQIAINISMPQTVVRLKAQSASTDHALCPRD